MTEPFDAELTRFRRLSDTTMDFRFRTLGGDAVEFEPGQFFRFTFTDENGQFERPYSPCNFTDAAADEIDLVISTVAGGRASEYLFHCEEGIKTTVVGPYGRLVIPQELPERLFLVATSVGIAPFLPMLSALKTRMAGEVFLLFGVRNRSEFLYQQELLKCRANWPNLSLQVCYSREDCKLLEYEYSGYITKYLAALDLDPDTDGFLVCGNPMMIDDCYELLKTRGFSARQVIREKYVFAKEKATVKTGLSAEQKKLIAEKVKKFQAGGRPDP